MRTIVCFDLGGVLVRIRRTWRTAADAAQVPLTFEDGLDYALEDFPLFDAFQVGSLGEEEYLASLAGYLGCASSDARCVHDAIMIGPYEGTDELVRDIRAAGHVAGCLSNTNSIHWSALDSPRFPAIQRMDVKVASHGLRLLKPDPTTFRLFDSLAETQPGSVVYFDDHEGNVRAAEKHGWQAFYIDHDSDPAIQMRAVLERLKIVRP